MKPREVLYLFTLLSSVLVLKLFIPPPTWDVSTGRMRVVWVEHSLMPGWVQSVRWWSFGRYVGYVVYPGGTELIVTEARLGLGEHREQYVLRADSTIDQCMIHPGGSFMQTDCLPISELPSSVYRLLEEGRRLAPPIPQELTQWPFP